MSYLKTEYELAIFFLKVPITEWAFGLQLGCERRISNSLTSLPSSAPDMHLLIPTLGGSYDCNLTGLSSPGFAATFNFHDVGLIASKTPELF